MKIGVRVTTISVGNKLEEDWAIAINSPLAGVLDGLMGRDDVHSVHLCSRDQNDILKGNSVVNAYLESRDQVTALEVFSVGGTTLGRCSHPVFVVFADKYYWEVP